MAVGKGWLQFSGGKIEQLKQDSNGSRPTVCNTTTLTVPGNWHCKLIILLLTSDIRQGRRKMFLDGGAPEEVRHASRNADSACHRKKGHAE